MPGPALSELTTLGVGGPAGELVEADDLATLAEALAAAAARQDPVLVLGGGSNLVVADAGFPGTVVHVAIKGIAWGGGAERASVSVQAGEDWSGFVRRCVEEGLAGVECLSGIPGSTGATPVQNVGAYGQEVSQVITSVSVWDRRHGERRTLAPAECGFAYRDSVFKHSSRYVVTEVGLALERSRFSRPVRYAELAERLGVRVGERAPLADTAEAVLSLRRAKGMVLDPGDPDTRSAGSFFMNPVLTDDQISALRQIAPGVPVWPGPQGTKVPAAWLVEKAGFAKGYRRGTAAISGKHALALTVRPGGSARDLMALAREVRNGVERRFGVRLDPEPLLVGLYL